MMKKWIARIALLTLALTLTGLTFPRTGEAQTLFTCTTEGASEYRVVGCCTLGFSQFTRYRLYVCQGGHWTATTTTKCTTPLCDL